MRYQPLLNKANGYVFLRPDTPNHSHSIINGACKPLSRLAISSALESFTVIFTVNLSGPSIGAASRAFSRKRALRNLSRSIGF